jgi:SNF2 family DNA or RNA helicase
VTIHHIICKDTVDEDVMAALEKKEITQGKTDRSGEGAVV